MGALFTFLQRNSVIMGDSLPVIHSTDALNLKHILRKKIIKPAYCDVFNEELSYLFVGRPAYKTEISTEAAYWELPCCFILDGIPEQPKRVYPFDSGGFMKQPSRLPSFITIMDIDEFEISADPRAIDKVIGTFFTSGSRYFLMDPRKESDFMRRFSIDVTDEEIRALYKLIDYKSGRGDDRRLSIELQYESPIQLNKKNVMAVVLPEIYLQSELIMNFIEVDLDAVPLSYPHLPIKKEYHYHAIYDVTQQFYKNEGLI